MRGLRRVAYWIAVVVVSAILAYLLIRVAERLDASQVQGALIAARCPARHLRARAAAYSEETAPDAA